MRNRFNLTPTDVQFLRDVANGKQGDGYHSLRQKGLVTTVDGWWRLTLDGWDHLRIHEVLIPFRGRSVDITSPVRVYRNLGKGKAMYSIRQDKYVVAHADAILLKDVRFVVSEAGRQRVIREKSKNVHAYAEGLLNGSAFGTNPTMPNASLAARLTYNPYVSAFFRDASTDTPLSGASAVLLNSNGVTYCHGYRAYN